MDIMVWLYVFVLTAYLIFLVESLITMLDSLGL